MTTETVPAAIRTQAAASMTQGVPGRSVTSDDQATTVTAPAEQRDRLAATLWAFRMSNEIVEAAPGHIAAVIPANAFVP
ncbi:hypothetical protein [Pseudonocardia xishanensis]|uniref:Uncharacterized protein n=1 Tax=Pseudonocardia xishanensis TaxID=630995 RepID=A0ABP8RYJ5_9PSEU